MIRGRKTYIGDPKRSITSSSYQILDLNHFLEDVNQVQDGLTISTRHVILEICNIG